MDWLGILNVLLTVTIAGNITKNIWVHAWPTLRFFIVATMRRFNFFFIASLAYLQDSLSIFFDNLLGISFWFQIGLIVRVWTQSVRTFWFFHFCWPFWLHHFWLEASHPRNLHKFITFWFKKRYIFSIYHRFCSVNTASTRKGFTIWLKVGNFLQSYQIRTLLFCIEKSRLIYSNQLSCICLQFVQLLKARLHLKKFRASPSLMRFSVRNNNSWCLLHWDLFLGCFLEAT